MHYGINLWIRPISMLGLGDYGCLEICTNLQSPKTPKNISDKVPYRFVTNSKTLLAHTDVYMVYQYNGDSQTSFRTMAFRTHGIHLDEGKSHSNVWSEILSWRGSDDAKHMKHRKRKEEKTCLLPLEQQKI
ncbi:hypothetical protein TNCV_4164061 [Trichonephila clavipes]|nr:hypothetical protein TNCV_4164061 [Trichonephila clavipes]